MSTPWPGRVVSATPEIVASASYFAAWVAPASVAPAVLRSLVLAIGRRGTPRKLEVPGEDLPKVTYALVDPGQYRGRLWFTAFRATSPIRTSRRTPFAE